MYKHKVSIEVLSFFYFSMDYAVNMSKFSIGRNNLLDSRLPKIRAIACLLFNGVSLYFVVFPVSFSLLERKK